MKVIALMLENFTKLNSREKVDLADSRKLIPKEHSFQIFLVIFRLIEHKTCFLAYFIGVFVRKIQFREN